MHSTPVGESLIESPVILSSSKPISVSQSKRIWFEYPAILLLPKHCFVCFRWRRRLSTLQFYSLPNRVDTVSSFAKDLRTLQFYSPPSHKASAATQSACLRILQSPFQAGNLSAHQKNLVWVPCSFFFSKTSGSVAARVWVPCNFTFLQAFKMLKSCGSSVWVPCNFISFQTMLPSDAKWRGVWVPCNFIFFQTLKTLRV